MKFLGQSLRRGHCHLKYQQSGTEGVYLESQAVALFVSSDSRASRTCSCETGFTSKPRIKFLLSSVQVC